MLAPRDLQHCPNSFSTDSSKANSNANNGGVLSPASSVAPSRLSAATVSFSGVSFDYDGTSVLRDLSFTLPRGLVVSLLGPSGCGKTSVLRLIAGLEHIDAGQIFLDDREVSSRDKFIAPELRAGVGEVGMVFQDFALFPHLSVSDNLALALSGCDERARLTREGYDFNGDFNKVTLDVAASRKARIESMLEMVELSDYAHKYPQELSGGQQQRVALARALVSSPRLLLLDEPFANLDVRLRDRIRDRTLHLVQSLRCSVLLVTHDAEEGMYLADSLLVMDERGCLLQSGSPRSVYEQPRDAFTASLLSEVNRFSVEIVDGYVSTPFGRYRANFSGESTPPPANPPVNPPTTPVANPAPACVDEASASSASTASTSSTASTALSTAPSSASSWAEVVVRPQSLSLSGEDGSARAGTAVGVVEAARMIGGHSLVHLSSCLPAQVGHSHDSTSGSSSKESKAGEALSIGDDCEHDCKPVHLHARVAGCFLPSRGTRVRIAVDSSDVFLFEQKGSRSL